MSQKRGSWPRSLSWHCQHERWRYATEPGLELPVCEAEVTGEAEEPALGQPEL